mmetsp:Transcript_44894/g.118541  ORF Transcript_44894/g.118541 Transcript_44894/m.118541 type:complete len:221 (+) Transcript_44894:3119-3781(+)
MAFLTMLTAEPVESSQLRPRSERAWKISASDCCSPLSYGGAYSGLLGCMHEFTSLHSVHGSAAAAQLVSRLVLAKNTSLWYWNVPAAVRCDSMASRRRRSSSGPPVPGWSSSSPPAPGWSSSKSSAISSSSDMPPVTSPGFTLSQWNPSRSTTPGSCRADMNPPELTRVRFAPAARRSAAASRRDATVAPPITYKRLSASTTAVAPNRWLMVVAWSVGTS